MFDTIVALATAPMKSAIAVIRVSGEDCYDIVSQVFTTDLRNLKKREIHYGYVKDNEQTIDEVMVINYVKPHSFTGENSVEIMCHGSMLIANEIIELLISKGARLATRGEFSSRAYLNGRIDLVQAEAINDVINATSSEAKNLSLLSLKGHTSQLLTPLKTRLADIISNVEVNIDYPEYQDIEVVNKEKIISVGNELINEITKLVLEGEEGVKIKEGIKVAIVGKPNVGKSSLLNALLKEDKAIVTDVAGTTRDVVEGTATFAGITYHFYDTAGIHDSHDKVEAIGIDKAHKVIEEADIVLLILEANKELDEMDQELITKTKDKNTIIVYNKMDQGQEKNNINISAKNGEIDALLEELYKRTGLSKESFKRPSLNNARQIGLLKRARQELEKAIEDAKNDVPVDLVNVLILEAYHHILAINGEDVSLDLSKEIFSRFCVGK